MTGGPFPAVGPQLPRRGGALSRGLGRAFLRLLGWRVTGQIPDLPKMVWIGAPHTTNWDGVLGLATLLALGVDASTMIKDSAFKGPLGWLLRGLGAIPINRASPKGVVEQSIDQFASRQRFVLLIAPEGTRDGADDWKRGYYRIAEGAGVPVLPASINYPAKIITFGPPLTPSGDYDADFAELLGFYRRFGVARHPQRLSKPLRR
ncbi:1-acyl-sn-glycerol-3-phosphate acyltransferase [Nevskia sp.]|uniref:1-acyl-sn-glycerol-3-phosphate acyltransferase n=1 Tax=Nevskia sp. TaxID=1929292 RepID=UPI003F6F6B56